MKQRIVLIFLSTVMFGCQCHEKQCQPYGIGVRLKGFDSASSVNITIRYYDTAGFYTQLQATSIGGLLYRNVNGFADTLLDGPILSPYHSWELFFPAINKTVRVYNIQYDHISAKVCDGLFGKVDDPCLAPISAYTQDGIYHNLALSSSSDNLVEIVR